MKDFAGQPLAVGDFVAFMRPHYRELCLGKITSFTSKKVHVAFRRYATSTDFDDFLSDPFNLVRLEPSDVLVLMLKGNG
jgi:hypothetical protein